jgi:hypothetical protein
MIIGNAAATNSLKINSVITTKAAATSVSFTSVSLSHDSDEQDERDANGEGQSCRRRESAHERTNRGERAFEAEQRHGEANCRDGDRELTDHSWWACARCGGCDEFEHVDLLAHASARGNDGIWLRPLGPHPDLGPTVRRRTLVP